jgi:hypothetical protein
MDKLRQIIREVIQQRNLKPDCGCGCNGKCAEEKAPMINENLSRKPLLSEHLQYHVDNKKPLTENTFRYGSPAFLDLWKEARKLYSRNLLEVSGLDKDIIVETNLGEYGIYEGQEVPLDLPMIEEELDESVVAATAAAIAARSASSSSNNALSTLTPDQLLLLAVMVGVPSLAAIVYNSGLVDKVKNWINNYKLNGVIKRLREDPEVIEFIKSKKPGIQNFLKSKLTDKEQKYLKRISWNKITKGEIKEGQVNEAEYQGKKVQLNKPKRGGSKKFYVYVMNPKTKKVKKVSFGAAGGGQNLAVKIRDPKARRAFASRQNCDKKKNRLTPGYWSCNIGRYWKSLGGGSNFSGYW